MIEGRGLEGREIRGPNHSLLVPQSSPEMSNEDDSPCMAYLGDSSLWIHNQAIVGVEGIILPLFFQSSSQHSSGHSGSRDSILCSFPSLWLLLESSYRTGAGDGLWRPRRKGLAGLALLQLLAEVLPFPSPAVPSLSCQLLPRPARGWAVEKERVASSGEGGCSPSC